MFDIDSVEEIEWVRLGDVLGYEQSMKFTVKDKNYNDDRYNKNNTLPVLTAGKTFILGYTDEEDNIYYANKEIPVIIFDDFTTAIRYIDFDFKVKSSAIKMLKAKEGSILKYVYYAMQTIDYVPKEHKRQWIETYSNIEIPLPPLQTQQKIVSQLDPFLELIEKLKEELRLRKIQYEYYRDKMFEFDDNDDVEWVRLGDVLGYEQSMKFTVKDKNYNDDRYNKNNTLPVLTAGKTFILGYTDEEDNIYYANKKIPVIIFDDFTTAIRYIDFDFKVKSSAIKMLKAKEGSILKYMYYAMQTIDYVPKEHKRQWIETYSNIEIPLPDINTQHHIASTLDTFTSLISKISNEISMREMQYSYYRDLLFSKRQSQI